VFACRLQEKPSAAESGRVGRQLPLPAKRFVARGSEPSASQAERFRNRVLGVVAPTCDLKILKAPCRAPANGAAGIALGRARVSGQRQQLRSNVRVSTKKNFFFIALSLREHQRIMPQAKPPKPTTRCGCSLFRRRGREASHTGGVFSTNTVHDTSPHGHRGVLKMCESTQERVAR